MLMYEEAMISCQYMNLLLSPTLPPDLGVMLTLVTDITFEDIMWEEIRGGRVVESTVAELMDPREDREDP